MFLTEWFGNGYVGNAAPKAFHVRPGVALDYTARPEEVRHLLRANTRAAIER